MFRPRLPQTRLLFFDRYLAVNRNADDVLPLSSIVRQQEATGDTDRMPCAPAAFRWPDIATNSGVCLSVARLCPAQRSIVRDATRPHARGRSTGDNGPLRQSLSVALFPKNRRARRPEWPRRFRGHREHETPVRLAGRDDVGFRH